jgi:hypothetical protein
MASTITYNAVKAHLVAGFPTLQVIDFDTLDSALEQNRANFLCLQEGYSVEDIEAFGDPTNICIRETSGFIIHVFVPSPQSSAQARTLGDQVQAAFRLTNLTPLIRVLDTNPPELEMMNDGLWTSASVPVTVDNKFHAPIAP